jgi:hypothetical protein
MHGSGSFSWPDGKEYVGKSLDIYFFEVNILKIKRMDMGYSNGEMEGHIRDSGKMENSMAKEL